MTDSRRHIIVLALAATLTILSLVVHLAGPSSIHQPEQNWHDRVSLHQTEPAFTVRPITTALIVFGHDTFGLSYRAIFFTLQFILMFFAVAVYYYFLRTFDFTHGYSVSGMLIFGLSLPVFLAHFDPMYTWSDFWIYLFIPLSFICIVRQWWLPAILSFIVALLARESSILFLPPWMMIIATSRSKSWKKGILPAMAVLTGAIFLRLLLRGVSTGHLEYKLAFNFESFVRSRDTIYSLLVSLGFLWPLGIYQILSSRHVSHPFYPVIRFGAVYTGVFFTLTTLLVAQARETRLFFPPAIFFIPLTLLYISTSRSVIIGIIRRLGYFRLWAIILTLVVVTQLITLALFPDFDFRTWKDGNRIWFGLHLCLTAMFVMTRIASPSLPQSMQKTSPEI